MTNPASPPSPVPAETRMHTDCKNRHCQMVADHVATLEATMLQWKDRAIAAEAGVDASGGRDLNPRSPGSPPFASDCSPNDSPDTPTSSLTGMPFFTPEEGARIDRYSMTDADRQKLRLIANWKSPPEGNKRASRD